MIRLHENTTRRGSRRRVSPTIREIDTGVGLGPGDGLPIDCVFSLDNFAPSRRRS